jgi:hypothetical protein
VEKKKILFLSEEDKRRIAKNRTPLERYELMLRLIRISMMLKNARRIEPVK